MSHGIESLKSLFSSDLSIVTILQRLYSSWSDSAFEGLLGSVPVPPILDSAAYYVSEVLKSDLIPVRLHYVRLQELSLARAVLCIALAPLIWNLVARMEYHTRLISRVVGRKIGAYLLATWIFCFSLYRDALFLMAIEDQPRIAALQETPCVVLGSASYLWGMLLVLSSMARLGILGTYLGDYFGFLLDGKVESFPFNLFDNPMYDGATLCFLGLSVMEQNVAGLYLSLWVYIVYQVAIAVEESALNIYFGQDRRKQKDMERC